MEVPQMHVGVGATLGPLTFFPVWTSGPGTPGLTTGTNASIAVTELAGGAQVGRLTATNNGPKAALLLEGELLEGGQQHRICVRDVVLAAGETRDIDTYCVEAGRWEHGQNSHRRQARRAPLNVRSELAAAGSRRGHNGQRRVWERVGRFETAMGVSATGSLLDHLDRAGQDKRQYRRADLPAPLEGQRGLIIGLGHRPLLLEVFGSSNLFLRHYRQLVDSTLLDLSLLPPQAMASPAMPGQAARDFAGLVQSMNFGTFDGAALPPVDNGPGIRSRTLTSIRGSVTAAGIGVELPRRQPQLAHLTCWNTKHPLMEMA